MKGKPIRPIAHFEMKMQKASVVLRRIEKLFSGYRTCPVLILFFEKGRIRTSDMVILNFMVKLSKNVITTHLYYEKELKQYCLVVIKKNVHETQ